jgi:hypothetical protein
MESSHSEEWVVCTHLYQLKLDEVLQYMAVFKDILALDQEHADQDRIRSAFEEPE